MHLIQPSTKHKKKKFQTRKRCFTPKTKRPFSNCTCNSSTVFLLCPKTHSRHLLPMNNSRMRKTYPQKHKYIVVSYRCVYAIRINKQKTAHVCVWMLPHARVGRWFCRIATDEVLVKAESDWIQKHLYNSIPYRCNHCAKSYRKWVCVCVCAREWNMCGWALLLGQRKYIRNNKLNRIFTEIKLYAKWRP